MVNVIVLKSPDMFAEWFLSLVMKSFSVNPMYVSVVLFSLRVSVAW